MWCIEDYSLETVQLDFTSSSGERPHAHAVVANGVRLVNAAEFADLSTDPTQVHVCEHCGIPGCEEGGYVRLRRIGDYCVWLPIFRSMLIKGWEAQQYAPPTFTEDRGIPVMDRSLFTRLQSQIRGLPAFEALHPLLASDAARIVQWDAPFNVLGPILERPALAKEMVLAVTNGDTVQECHSLQMALDDFIDAENAAVQLAVGGDMVEFHLDGPRFPAWTPMRAHDSFRSLQLFSKLAVRLPG